MNLIISRPFPAVSRVLRGLRGSVFSVRDELRLTDGREGGQPVTGSHWC